MINAQTLQGNWNEVKGALKEQWGALTSDDLRSFNGNVDQLVGLIQRKTGESREAVQKFLEEATAEGSSFVAAAAQSARDYANRAAESVSDTYENITDQVRGGYSDAEGMVRSRPGQSVAVAFGVGMIAGLLVGLTLRSR
jgi:uncharacterized protein YjbJ (UPF0337 family)